MPDIQWLTNATNPVAVEGEHGKLLMRLHRCGAGQLLVATSEKAVELPIVRFQSACVFGEAFGAVDCDCGVQLRSALELISRDGGVVTYGWEEGRGLGIESKLLAMALQQSKKISTAEAFQELGHDPEPRDFKNHIEALRTVYGGTAIRLASSNPKKIEALEAAGIRVVERVDLPIPMTPARERYLEEKRAALGHLG